VDATGVVNALFAAIERGDVDGVAALYADDFVIWHNFDRLEQARDLNLTVLTWMTHNVRNLRYEEVSQFEFDGGLVRQHVLRGTTATGADLEVPCCMVVHVEGDKITRIAEYLDSAHLTPLFG
jgi:ketosteroid isomerase-like protein